MSPSIPRLAAFTMLLVGACSPKAPGNSHTEVAITAVNLAPAGATSELRVDIILRNGESTPRWFVLPATVPYPGLTDTLVDSLYGHEYTTNGRIVRGAFTGRGQINTFLVPARGWLKVEGLALSLFGQRSATLTVPVIVASDIHVGGLPARSWFYVDPLSESGAVGTIERVASVHMEPNMRRLPLRFDEDQRFSVKVQLPAP